MPAVLHTYFAGIVTSVLMLLNTLFFAIPGYIATLIKLSFPFAKGQLLSGSIADFVVKGWLWGMVQILKLRHSPCINMRELRNLRRDESYLVIANHQSWADFMALLPIFQSPIPIPKAFIRKELFWIPIIGTAFWTLDFPFVKRYSRRYLKKHPEKCGKDLEITKKACERYNHRYISILNFPEGGLFSEEKHLAQRSPYNHLLRPKAGGLATALYAMDRKITTLIDITIVYPENRISIWNYLRGNLSPITVLIKKYPIPREFFGKEYTTDTEFKSKFQSWTNAIWREKDELIEQMLKDNKTRINS